MQLNQDLPDGYCFAANFYSLYQETATRFHAWLQNAEFSDFGQPYFLAGDSDYTHSGYLASAEKVLSVAAYTTRPDWTDMAGDTWHYSAGETEGQICSFSSRGPLASSISKPDIAAPGSAIVSAGRDVS